MTPLHNIPYTAPAAPVAHGLLNMPTTDLLGYVLICLFALVGLFLMPGQLRQSLASLWAPVGAWLARLRVAVAGMGVFIVLGLVAPLRACAIIARDWSEGTEQLVRLAYSGFDRPVLT